MKNPWLYFHGAAGGVTGSCFRLEFAGKRILIDCGLFQGSKSEKELNYRPFPFEPRSIDAVILTHSHIDHSGLIPKLVKEGFAGQVYATSATVDLCAVMLPDSGHIQEIEVKQLNKRNLQRGRHEVEPIYTASDAVASITQLRPVKYGVWFSISPAIRARFWNAGHLLGSASVEVELRHPSEEAEPVRLLYSGDIGPAHKLMQRDPEGPSGVDYVICESTYGDSERQECDEERRRLMLRDEVRAARHPNGVLLIPSFAVERTQELLADLHRLMESGELPWTPVYIDSPLATKASAVFDDHAADIEEGGMLREAMRSRYVHFTEGVEQSKAIGKLRSFHIVIAASGMCDAGRIRHHLKNWLWSRNATVLLVGYQAQGSLGRILQDGAERVRIQGEEVRVGASIRSLDLYSGHADGSELADWIAKRMPIRQGIFLVHGEEAAAAALRQRVEGLNLDTEIITPTLDAVYELTNTGPRRSERTESPRVTPEKLGHLDWHNDLSRLLLDINDIVNNAADERSRAVVIRRLRRALVGEGNKS